MHGPVISSRSDSFAADVLQSPTPVVVEFTARWCAPCRRLAPLLDELARRHAGQVRVVVVDVEATPDLAQAYRVSAMPTLLGFRGGEVVAQQVGFGGRAAVERLFDDLATGQGASGAAGSGGKSGSGTTTLKP